MPPKEGKRGLSTTVKALGLTRANAAKSPGKKAVASETLADLEYLHGIQAPDGEKDRGTSEKDIRRVFGLFTTSREKKSKDLLVASGEAISRICGDPVLFVKFLEADVGVVETIAACAGDPPEAGGKFSAIAVDGLSSGAVSWMEGVDPVDFNELSRLLYLSLWLGGIDEDVAVAAVDAIKRFTLHRAEHAAGMLQAGVLNVLHRLLSAHRSPEFVTEVLAVLYLMTDMPFEAVGERVNDEIELVTTIVESLQSAPLNMRLQLTGIRLLALWATRLRTQEEIPDAIKKAGAQKLLEDVVLKLDGGGFDHATTWLTTIAQRAFTEGLKLEVDGMD